MYERCCIGWKPMAAMFQKNVSWVFQFKSELQSLGLIFYRPPGTGYRTASGKKVTKPMVHWFPGDIRAYWRAKSKKEYEEKMGIEKT